MLRHYIAVADNGRDFIDFEFTSEYRADSKGNFTDAVEEYRRRHGHKVVIIATTLIND